MNKPTVTVKNGKIELTPAPADTVVMDKNEATARRQALNFELTRVNVEIATLQSRVASITSEMADWDAAIVRLP